MIIRVLIVEDDPFLSLDLASQLVEFGFSVTGIAPNVATALDLFDRRGCDVAVLDVNLGAESAAPVARKLAAQNVPFIAVTGYSQAQCPPEFGNGTVIGKPLRIERLVAELQRCVAAD
jgi:DNA-binding response OmpR family regulator